ncbi:acyl-CoA N-acyltransferase [Coniochaeta sp. 2T2.1]|nr:acyl-CoA N-acyltransferase [Coniochaeta sp. 2T2.1]
MARTVTTARPSPVEKINSSTDEEFSEKYLTPAAPGASPWVTAWSDPRTGQEYSIGLCKAPSLDKTDLGACFDLVAETSKVDYEASKGGWRPKSKLIEMRSPDLRYILVKDEDGTVAAFTSLMPTREEGQLVVYCYEIHLKPNLQGAGLGRMLMGYLFTVALNTGLHKVMLTCFVSNNRALNWYRQLGFQTDAISPQQRTLRSGRVFIPDYVILSKTMSRQPVRQSNVTNGGEQAEQASAHD